MTKNPHGKTKCPSLEYPVISIQLILVSVLQADRPRQP